MLHAISRVTDQSFCYDQTPYTARLDGHLITLVRHAESAANAGLASSDPSLIPLTDKGVSQALAFSQTITEAPAIIITSPFSRAMDTGKPTMSKFPNVPVEQLDIGEFTYLDPASCAGTTAGDRKARVDAFWQSANPDYLDGPGAESFSGFIHRTAVALERLRALDGNAIVFGHGQVMQAMRWLLRRAPEVIDSEAMRDFRRYDLANPIRNCESFDLELSR